MPPCWEPRRSHEIALVRVVQYVKGTNTRGLILRPLPLRDKFTTDIYVVADFAGGWGYDEPDDSVCVKSRLTRQP
jgi:hypothetical protein